MLISSAVPLAAASLNAPAITPVARVRGRQQDGNDSEPSATKRAAPPSDELDLSSSSSSVEQLSPEEQDQVQQLADRDREVRAHEQAHLSAAGPYATGGPNYTYQTGPDGRNYAIGGEVQIDTAPVDGDPEATIQKAQVVRAAALAPAEPSAQDRRVAAAATKMQQQATAELREAKSQKNESPAQSTSSSQTTEASRAYAINDSQEIVEAIIDFLA